MRCAVHFVSLYLLPRRRYRPLRWGLAFGGVGPRRAGGAVEGGEVFDGGGEVGHGFNILVLPDTIGQEVRETIRFECQQELLTREAQNIIYQ
jgi:hypothetical protein